MVVVHIIAAAGAVASAGLSAIAVVKGGRNAKAIEEVHLTLNSRLDALIKASVDQGRIAERLDIASGVQGAPPSSVPPSSGPV